MNESVKVYYSISEVCNRSGLEPHVLRYWESEFPQLRPKKNRAGNRAYREKDIQIIEYIKYLLYEEKFTIPGAKKKLTESKDGTAETAKPAPVQQSGPGNGKSLSIEELKNELGEVLKLIKA
jgi:DNA-binding transcriptional MerR regulator